MLNELDMQPKDYSKLKMVRWAFFIRRISGGTRTSGNLKELIEMAH